MPYRSSTAGGGPATSPQLKGLFRNVYTLEPTATGVPAAGGQIHPVVFAAGELAADDMVLIQTEVFTAFSSGAAAGPNSARALIGNESYASVADGDARTTRATLVRYMDQDGWHFHAVSSTSATGPSELILVEPSAGWSNGFTLSFTHEAEYMIFDPGALGDVMTATLHTAVLIQKGAS